jgi:hypothetical protein
MLGEQPASGGRHARFVASLVAAFVSRFIFGRRLGVGLVVRALVRALGRAGIVAGFIRIAGLCPSPGPADLDAPDDITDSHRLARALDDLDQRARLRRSDFEVDLVALDDHERRVHLDVVAHALQPLTDRDLGDGFAGRGGFEVEGHEDLLDWGACFRPRRVGSGEERVRPVRRPFR